MQLTGPPKLNDWTAPYCSAQTPLDAAFSEDQDLTTWRKNRNGLYELVGQRHLRGRFRLEWKGLTYQQASRIRYELSQYPVTLTPRTDIGRGGIVDTDDDGIPDRVLQEVALDCRIVSEIPTSTELYRRFSDGDPEATFAIELETLETFQETPGFTTPPVLTYKAYAEYTNPDPTDAWTVGLNATPQIEMFVDWDDGTTETGINPTHEYPPDGGPYDISAVLYTSQLDELKWTGSTVGDPGLVIRVDLTPTDLSKLTVDTFRAKLPGGRMFGDITDQTPDTRVWATGQFDGFSYAASDVSRDNRTFKVGSATEVYGDVNNLPPDQKELRLRASGLSQTVINAGGPVGPSTTFLDLRRSGITLGQDFRSSGIDNNGPAPYVSDLKLDSNQQDVAGLFRTMRNLESVMQQKGPMVDLSGVPPVPPALTSWSFQIQGVESWGSDLSWVTQVDTLAQNMNGRGSEDIALSITNGVPQVQIMWDALYDRRANLKSPSVNLDQRFNGAVNSGGNQLICTATQASDLWKMIGLHSYHPDNGGESVLDYVQSLKLSNLLAFDTKSYTSDSITFDWTLEEKTPNEGAPGTVDRRAFFVYDESNGNQPEAWVEKQGSGQWLPIFQPGQQFRLRGATTDKLFEIASQSYDPTTDELTLTIDTGSTQNGVSTSIPENGEVVYGFYYQSQP